MLIPKFGGLERDSLLLAEQIRTIDRFRLDGYIGRVPSDLQPTIDDALAIAIGLEQCRSPKGEMITVALCSRCESGFRNFGYLLVKKGLAQAESTCGFCKISKGWSFAIFNNDWRE